MANMYSFMNFNILFPDFCKRDDGDGKRITSRKKEHREGISWVSPQIYHLSSEGKEGKNIHETNSISECT